MQQNITGFINVNKPKGVVSSAAVNKLKRLCHTPCGHMGTLDPLASGVLPVGIGNASRLFDYFLSKKKTYVAQFWFGVTSDTLDTEGEIKPSGFVPAEADIRATLPSLTGDVMQVPPLYSAKSVNGVRGYRLAREGKDFTLPPKKVTIDAVELLSDDGEGRFSFRVECGGGTYIRSIARDLGAALGTSAVMSGLTREKSGCFTLENAVPLDDITAENVLSFLIPTEEVLPYPPLDCRNSHIFNGLAVSVSAPDGLYKLYRDGAFYGVAQVSGGKAKAKTKLC